METTDLATAPRAPLRCLFCGEPEHLQLHEIWEHEFMIETCCEGLHEQVAVEMADDPAWVRELLRRLDIEDFTGHRLRRLADDGGAGMLLDWQLRIEHIHAGAVRRFIAQHHAHCGNPTAWRFDAAIFNGPTLMGVAVVGNPVARALMGRGIVEVNRLCIRRDTADALRWNAASMLYGWCAREAERRGFTRIITYTRADEPGVSLAASGWAREARIRGRGWHSAARRRSNMNSWIDKIRWSRALSPRPQPTIKLGKSEPSWPISMLTEPMTGRSVFGSTPA